LTNRAIRFVVATNQPGADGSTEAGRPRVVAKVIGVDSEQPVYVVLSQPRLRDALEYVTRVRFSVARLVSCSSFSLCRIVVQRVVVRDRRLESNEWVPAARPFFERQREYPQWALGTRPLSIDDSLAWYVA
jgi:hypothetical protein